MKRSSLKQSAWCSAFSLLEVMIAMAIFMMVMGAVYATWTAILKGTKVGLEAAANVQRSRIALRTLQDALLTAVFYDAPLGAPNLGRAGRDKKQSPYTFAADSSGDFAWIEFSARLPGSFLGMGRSQGCILRRVRFEVEPFDQRNQLVMYQWDLLSERPSADEMAGYRTILSPDVTEFKLLFADGQKNDLEDWKLTNSLPLIVEIKLGQGKQPGSNKAHDYATTLVSLPGGRRTVQNR